jgi:hypothetical protein
LGDDAGIRGHFENVTVYDLKKRKKARPAIQPKRLFDLLAARRGVGTLGALLKSRHAAIDEHDGANDHNGGKKHV